jgi:hypothetical protein
LGLLICDVAGVVVEISTGESAQSSTGAVVVLEEGRDAEHPYQQ